jgi:hypothetical protein
MAGPVWDSKGHNPTGYGVKLLTEFLLSHSERVIEEAGMVGVAVLPQAH